MATNKPGAAGNDGKKEVEEGLLWGGRFTGQNDPLMVKFNASISFDKRMWRQDITGQIRLETTLYSEWFYGDCW